MDEPKKVNYIQNINKELIELLKDEKVEDEKAEDEIGSDGKVNNIKMILGTDESKISITLKPDKLDNKSDYYGLSPSFSEDTLKDFLYNNQFVMVSDFWNAIKKMQVDNKYMNIAAHISTNKFSSKGINNEELDNILLGRAVLQMASKFGFSFKLHRDFDINNFKNNMKFILKNYFEETCYKNINENVIKNEKEPLNCKYEFPEMKDELHILGVWPREIIEELCKLYIVDENNDIKIRISSDSKENKLFKILTFEYKNSGEHNSTSCDSWKLLDGEVYYSGVMPRVKAINIIREKNCSKFMKFIEFKVGRTTFATLDFMDNSEVLRHPFFMNSKYVHYFNAMLDFDNNEDLVQSLYLYKKEDNINDQREYEDLQIKNINQYLENSFNTHTIAVSSNITTSDNYLIIGKRSKKSCDPGMYYCSSNGQSEFRDKHVDFYRKSVFEDLPTMEYDSEYRVDLNQEIQREALAELGITSFESEWHYYGISYLSRNNFVNKKTDDIDKSLSYKVQKRRMHFNVLTSNTTSLTFKEVLQRQKKATENFENQDIKGIKTVLYKNNFDLWIKNFFSFFKWLNKNKSNVLLFFLFFMVFIRKEKASIIGFGEILEAFFLITYLGIGIFSFYKNREIRSKKINFKVCISKYKKNNDYDYKKFIKIISSKIDNKDNGFHAILSLMYSLYFYDEAQKVN